MSSSVAPFSVDANSQGNNTRIDYHFTSEKRTVKGSVVVEGKFSDEDISALRQNLDEGSLFNPGKLGIPDLFHKMPASWDGDETDHVIDRIALSNAQYDADAPSFDQLVGLVDTAPQVWSTETAAPASATV